MPNFTAFCLKIADFVLKKTFFDKEFIIFPAKHGISK
jgi:hypothetical protein